MWAWVYVDLLYVELFPYYYFNLPTCNPNTTTLVNEMKAYLLDEAYGGAAIQKLVQYRCHFTPLAAAMRFSKGEMRR